ncbi:unnamed protein product [Brassica oleracea]
MATSYTLLVDSKAGCCSNTAEFVDCGLVDHHGFSRNKIRVIDDNIPSGGSTISPRRWRLNIDFFRNVKGKPSD